MKNLRTYGRYKNREDTALCIEKVFDHFDYRQCTLKRGHGPTGEYCAIHSPEAVAKRESKKEQSYAASRRAFSRTSAYHAIGGIAVDFVHGEATKGELIKAVKKYEDLK